MSVCNLIFLAKFHLLPSRGVEARQRAFEVKFEYTFNFIDNAIIYNRFYDKSESENCRRNKMVVYIHISEQPTHYGYQLEGT